MVSESLAILKRNISSLINSKLSFIIIFIGPIFLMLIVGVALQNNELRNIRVGIYTQNPEDLKTDEFMSGFVNKIGDTAQEYSLETCKNRVINSEYHACVEIKKSEEYTPIDNPSIISQGSIDTPSYQVISYVDFSKTKTVWGIINRIQKVVDLQSQEMMGGKVKEATIKMDYFIDKIQTEKNRIGEVKSQIGLIKNYLGDMESDVGNIKSQTTTAIGEINGINNKINSVMALVASIPEATNQLNGIRTDLNNVLQKLNYIEQLTGTTGRLLTNLRSIKSRIEEINTDLSTTESALENIINEWNNLKNTDLSSISKPVTHETQSILGGSTLKSSSLKEIDYLFPSLLMFFIIFISLVFPTTLIIKERASKAHIRNITSKTNGTKFVVINFISGFMVIFLQIILIMLISKFFLNINILDNITSTIILSIISIITLGLIGVMIGYAFNNYEGAVMASISLSIILLIFLPVITPTETLPAQFSQIFQSAPSVILSDKIRMSVLAGTGYSFSISEAISIIITIILTIILTIMFYNKNKRKEI